VLLRKMFERCIFIIPCVKPELDCMYGQPADWHSSAKRVYVLRMACERYTGNKSRIG